MMASIALEPERGSKRALLMELKHPHEMRHCKNGRIVVLNLISGGTIKGVFKALVDDDTIWISSLDTYSTFGVGCELVSNYYEEWDILNSCKP